MIPLHRIYPGQFSVRNHPIPSLHDLFPLQIQGAGNLKDKIRTAGNATAMRMDRSHTSGDRFRQTSFEQIRMRPRPVEHQHQNIIEYLIHQQPVRFDMTLPTACGP